MRDNNQRGKMRDMKSKDKVRIARKSGVLARGRVGRGSVSGSRIRGCGLTTTREAGVCTDRRAGGLTSADRQPTHVLGFKELALPQ